MLPSRGQPDPRGLAFPVGRNTGCLPTFIRMSLKMFYWGHRRLHFALGGKCEAPGMFHTGHTFVC